MYARCLQTDHVSWATSPTLHPSKHSISVPELPIWKHLEQRKARRTPARVEIEDLIDNPFAQGVKFVKDEFFQGRQFTVVNTEAQ